MAFARTLIAGALLVLAIVCPDAALAALADNKPPVEAFLAGEGLSAEAILTHHAHTGDLLSAAAAAAAVGQQQQATQTSPVLAYVTPWNGRGYDLAKQHRCRLEYVSPVWYQLRSAAGVLTLTGGHDVDAGWLAALREPCADGGSGDSGSSSSSTGAGSHTLHVVPRVIFELQGQEAKEAFERPQAVAALLANEAQRHAFDGWVFEGWSLWAAMGITQHPQLRPFALRLLRGITGALSPAGRRLLLAVSPLVPAPGRPAQLTQQDVEDLLDLVDGLSVMMYDWGSGQQAGPNAPLPWVEQNADAFAAIADRLPGKPRHKVLLGLPFYGYEYTFGQGGRLEGVEAVLAGRVLDILREQQQAVAAGEGASLGSGSEEEEAQRRQQCMEEEADEDGEEGGGNASRGGSTCAAAGSGSLLRIQWLGREQEHTFEWTDPEAGAGGKAGKAKRRGKKAKKGGQPAKRHLLYFPTPRFLAERLAAAAQRGMGVAVWELGQGMDAFCSLI